MQLQTHATAPAVFAPPAAQERLALDAGSILLRPLLNATDIERVLPLRDGIDVAASRSSLAEFRRLEKKETSAASWSPSSRKAKRSGRSGSSPWASSSR
jgi:hypothetical protein